MERVEDAITLEVDLYIRPSLRQWQRTGELRNCLNKIEDLRLEGCVYCIRILTL